MHAMTDLRRARWRCWPRPSESSWADSRRTASGWLVGDRLTERAGAVRLLRVGAVVAFVALVVIVAAPSWPVAGALIGAVLTGAVGSGSLRVGFAVPLVLVLALFPLARAFAPADTVSGKAVPTGA